MIRTLKPGKGALGSDVMAIWSFLETEKSVFFILVSGLSVVLGGCSGVSLRGIHRWYIGEVAGGVRCCKFLIWDDGRVVCMH